MIRSVNWEGVIWVCLVYLEYPDSWNQDSRSKLKKRWVGLNWVLQYKPWNPTFRKLRQEDGSLRLVWVLYPQPVRKKKENERWVGSKSWKTITSLIMSVPEYRSLCMCTCVQDLPLPLESTDLTRLTDWPMRSWDPPFSTSPAPGIAGMYWHPQLSVWVLWIWIEAPVPCVEILYWVISPASGRETVFVRVGLWADRQVSVFRIYAWQLLLFNVIPHQR